MRYSKFSAAAVVAALLMSMMPGYVSGGNDPVDRGDGTLENTGDWLIESSDVLTYTDDTIIINGNITINGSLELNGCRLIMNMSYSEIVVNGELSLVNTNISGNGTSYYFFKVYGAMSSYNSNFTDMAGSDDIPYVGGLQLYNDDIEIQGGEIFENEFTGAFVNSDVNINDTTIRHNNINLVVNNSSPTFFNCRFEYPSGETLFITNDSSPSAVECEILGGKEIDDEESSLRISHLLHVRVRYVNETPIKEALVNAKSDDALIDKTEKTGEDGWVHSMVIPEYTIYKTGSHDIHTPYMLQVEKSGLRVYERVEMESETYLNITLTGDYFGKAVAQGDIDNNGYADLVVGAPENTTGTEKPGAVFIYLNRGDLEVGDPNHQNADIKITGTEGFDFGSTLAAGDINGDGFDEILIGALSSEENGTNSGTVYFFLGSEEPMWDDISDADFKLHGKRGANFGKKLLTAELNNDDFSDFIIGDNSNSYVYYGNPTPADKYAGVSEITAYPTRKGGRDITGEPISDLRANDGDRYRVDSPPPHSENNKLHVMNYSIGSLSGEITEVTLEMEFDTSQYYGWRDNEWEQNYVEYRIGPEDDWHDTVLVTNENQNQLVTFDLFADGVTTREQLQKLEFYHKNSDGTENGSQSSGWIAFDIMNIHVKSRLGGPNHTLISGNLSTGDVNGDGFADLVVSHSSRQLLYFGTSNGISAPKSLQINRYAGESYNTSDKSGNLTIAKKGAIPNGNFDSGWENWYQVENWQGEKDDNVRWEVTTEENGDWKVLDGATAGFGSPLDTLGGQNSQESRDCRARLRSESFMITDDVDNLSFSYHYKYSSFEDAGGDQGSTADQLWYMLMDASNDSNIMTFTGSSGGDDAEDTGVIDMSIAEHRGKECYLAVDIVSNHGRRDKGIAQIDNVALLPPPEKPYFEMGIFESDWLSFSRNLSSFTPEWEQIPNNGTVSVKFRTNNSINWSEISDFTSGEKVSLASPSSKLQYNVTLENNGTNTPVLKNLSISYLLEEQMVPMSLDTNSGDVKIANIDGDETDDLLFAKENGIDMHNGSENIALEYNTSNITVFYSGEFENYAKLDLENDGVNEIILTGQTTRVLDSQAQTISEKTVESVHIAGNSVSDPNFHLNTGKIYFVPASDVDLRVYDTNIPQMVTPDSEQEITILISNVGMEDAVQNTLYLNITAQGYSREFTEEVDISSMESKNIVITWNVPSDEAVDYTVSAELPVPEDRDPENNNLTEEVRSKHHGITMDTEDFTASAHGGDELSYTVNLTNTGTFESENISLHFDIPSRWTGKFSYQGETITNITVTDSEQVIFTAVSPYDEEADDFLLNITGASVTAITGLDLTGAILRPDLLVEKIELYRGDGVKTNDTIHGVHGDNETLRFKIINSGQTYSTEFNATLKQDESVLKIFTITHLDSMEGVWLEYGIIPQSGQLNISVESDFLNEVPEEDETNNNQTAQFLIKTQDPIGDYNIEGQVYDVNGENVKYARVTLEWGSRSEDIFTDENGTFTTIIPAANYSDAMLVYLNATDGTNQTTTSFLIYSEDTGKNFELVLNQYLVDIQGPETISEIENGKNVTIVIEMGNKGNIDSEFVLDAPEIPEEWSVEFPGETDGEFFIPAGEKIDVEVKIIAPTNSLKAKGHMLYYVTLEAHAKQFPNANDSYTHGLEVQPKREIIVSVLGDNSSEAKPYEKLQFALKVENKGNLNDTFIPTIPEEKVSEYGFNVSYLMLNIGEIKFFTLNITMPNIPTRDSLDLVIGEDGATSEPGRINLTALDFYSIGYQFPEQISAKPGENAQISGQLENTGNIIEEIEINYWSPREGLTVESDSEILEPEEEINYFGEVAVPEDAVKGETMTLYVNLSVGSEIYYNFTVELVAKEKRGVELTWLDITIIPGSDFTIYSYDFEIENTGNGDNKFYFKGEGDSPSLMTLPEPVTLAPGETREVTAENIAPMNRTRFIDNYLVAFDGKGTTRDINMTVSDYMLKLDIDITITQEENTFYYNVSMENKGNRFERLNLKPKIPEIDDYEEGDREWEGKLNKDVIELYPGDKDNVIFTVETPEKREYWSGEFSIDIASDSEKGMKINGEYGLFKPPISIISFSQEGPFSFEDSFKFIGSQSYYSILEYHWDFGDGDNETGSTVNHIFDKSGEYEVVLEVVDENGLTAVSSLDIVIENQPPSLIIRTLPLNRTVKQGAPIKFDASDSMDRDGEIVNYYWGFGDFESATWPEVEHVYDDTGVYFATLTLTDNKGAVSNDTVTIDVVPADIDQDKDDVPVVVTEEETTDPISYIPALIAVLVVAIGAFMFFKKKNLIKTMESKISAEQEKLGQKEKEE